MDVKLACESVKFRYDGRVVLSDISFALRPGVFCALLGRNGSGKTTLLHCLNKLLRPCEGRIRVNNIDIADMSQKEVARQVSLVPLQFWKWSCWAGPRIWA